MILHALSPLADALLRRSKLSNQPEDAIYAVKYLFYLRVQPQEHVRRHQVTTLLVKALYLQAELGAGNEVSDVLDMAVLYRELVEASDDNSTHVIRLIAKVAESRITVGIPYQPLDELIECLRAARKPSPDLLEGRLALALFLTHRYCLTFVNDDYEEAASMLDEIITSNSPSDKFNTAAQAQGLVTMLAGIRWAALRSPEYLEEAIYRERASFASSSLKELYPSAIFDPEDIAKRRIDFFGSIEGVETSSDNLPSSHSVQVMSESDRTEDKLKALLFGIRNDDTAKIDEAIEKGRTILATYSPTDTSMGPLCKSFGKILYAAFEHTKKIEYLNEAISTYRHVIESPLPQLMRFIMSADLAGTLLIRFAFFPGHRTQDLDEGLELLSEYAGATNVSFLSRFKFACLWAHHARRTRHHSVPSAYESAVSLMQDALHFSPTLQLQHTILATYDISHSLPLDHASYQVDMQQLEEAIETLERGRALLWSEMRHLRASLDQLLEADQELGHKFATVNRDLEELTKSIPPSHMLSMDDVAAGDLKAVDPFGRFLVKQRALLKERDELISRIRALPSLDSFLTLPSFDELSAAASFGPVIIINHSEWRSDILVLLHNSSPSLIPTPRDFYYRASALKDKLLDSRHKHGLDSTLYDEILASVLKELYELVGKPVIDRLRELEVPEQSRVWWCPTSVFCSLPLHAMGPIPCDHGERRYFLDLYICSYTPTLSALIQSRNRDSGSRSSDRPSILLVAQHDLSLPTVGGEIQVVQALDTEVTSLISEAATPATVIDGFHHHGFVHFACHGTLEANKPFEAGFELYGGERLTLLEIVRSHIPTAEFAFLSACHTAEVTEGSIMDEGLHIAAAVQYCGFRSVVGTMWAMVDEDGRDLAKHFYKALLSPSRRDQGIPHHERSAKALRFAVKKLRGKRWITLERWVNFVHYGA